MNNDLTPAGLIVVANEGEVELELVVQPIVLAGGSRTRLWPLSREHCPKQLIDLFNGESLLEATLRRLDRVFEHAAGDDLRKVRKAVPLVVSSEDLRHLTADRFGRSGIAARIVLEPLARNTAPALTATAGTRCWLPWPPTI